MATDNTFNSPLFSQPSDDNSPEVPGPVPGHDASAPLQPAAAASTHQAPQHAEPATQVLVPEPSPEQEPAGEGLYRRRRAAFAALLTASFVAVGAWLVASPMLGEITETTRAQAAGPVPSEAGALEQSEGTAAKDAVHANLEAAAVWRRDHGTYVGFVPTGDASVAASDDVLLIASRIAGRCWYSGLIPGEPVQVLADESACQPGQIAAAQAALNKAAAPAVPQRGGQDKPPVDYFTSQYGS